MKKSITLLVCLLIFASSQTLLAQRGGPAPSPKATVKQMIGTTEMEIIYSRPSLDGRDAKKLVNTLNKGVWRTGANSNTLISFNKDVTIGGKALAAGKYSLWTIPGDSEWTVIISGHLDKWGTQYDNSKDVLKFTATASTIGHSVETFTINMTDFDKNSKDKANIELAWGNISVKFPVKVTN